MNNLLGSTDKAQKGLGKNMSYNRDDNTDAEGKGDTVARIVGYLFSVPRTEGVSNGYGKSACKTEGSTDEKGADCTYRADRRKSLVTYVPSDDDIIMTKGFENGGKLLGIQVLDHIVIGRYDYYSFLEHDRMSKEENQTKAAEQVYVDDYDEEDLGGICDNCQHWLEFTPLGQTCGKDLRGNDCGWCEAKSRTTSPIAGCKEYFKNKEES